jgi:hypothetical protein
VSSTVIDRGCHTAACLRWGGAWLDVYCFTLSVFTESTAASSRAGIGAWWWHCAHLHG